MAETPAIVTAPKHAMVLAAGLGTRMRAFSHRIPKPLVVVGGKALIDHVLDRLAAEGVERAVVNVHHLADQIERHLVDRQQPKIVISDERAELLGTGGGVVKALPALGGRDRLGRAHVHPHAFEPQAEQPLRFRRPIEQPCQRKHTLRRILEHRRR